jgi:hypothetical protein
MATTTYVPWIALGFSLFSTGLAIGVPAYVYFFDKSAAGVMAEDKIKKANGAFVVEKQQEMANNLLNPANLLGGLKTAATAAATNMANKQISDTTGDALKRAEEIGGSSNNTEGGLEMTGIQSPYMSSIPTNMSSLNPDSLNNATSAIGIPGLTPEDNQRRMQKMKEANIKYEEMLKNAPTSATNTNVLKPFGKNNIKNFVANQSNYTPGSGDVLNTVSPNRRGGGRKTKNNRQKTVQPKIKKPRTKKCLITKGDKMFMSFCI